MNPKDIALRNKQRERRQRGNDFQDEMRKSWRLVPNSWRMRIADGGGSTRPADEIILTPDVNILAEHKRTEGRKFELSMLRAPQLQGLVDFDSVIDRNYGLVFVSFHNPAQGLDECYAIRLITALQYMKNKERQYIGLDELYTDAGFAGLTKTMSIKIERLEPGSELYDVRGVPKYCRYL